MLGRDHVDTLCTRHGIAHELLRSGEVASAERELRVVLLDRARILGRRHPDTLTSLHALALARAIGGELLEAAASLEALLVDQVEMLGPEHRHTLNTRERLAWTQEPDTQRVRARLTSPDHEVDEFW